MSNVGYATLTVMPSAKGFASALRGEIDSPLTSAGGESGKKSGNAFLGGFKSLVGVGMAIAAAGTFKSFISEAARASDATQKFVSTMSFAGLDTGAITAAKNEAKTYADQTVYDLPTIQNMIAQLASNGVADYTGLTKAAGNLNAVAGGNAETFKSVAMVMTQTAGAGKLTTENWNQLSDAIPGAAGPLMKAMKDAGAYTGNFRDAMAAGEITSEEFNAALMKLGTDPIAVEAAKSTETFEGALGNLEATINSGLMTALDALKPAITGVINLASKGLGAAFDGAGKFFEPLTGAVTAFGAAFKAADGDITSSGLAGVFEQIGGAMGKLWAGFTMGADEVVKIGSDLDPLVAIGYLVKDAFTQIGNAFSPLIPQVLSLASNFSPLSIIFQALMPVLPALLNTFVQLGVGIGGTLIVALQSLVPVVQIFVQHLSNLAIGIMPAVTAMIGMVGNAFTMLVPVVMDVISAVMPLVVSLMDQLSPIIVNLVTSILPPLVSIFGNVVGAIAPLIATIAGNLIPVISALLPVVVTVFSVVADVVKNAMQIVQGIIQVVTGIITGNWSSVWAGIQNIVGGVWNTITSLVSGAIRVVLSVISGTLSAISGIWSSIWSGILGFLGGIWGGISGAISGGVGTVVGILSSLPGRALGAISGMVGQFTTIGSQMIAGLANGIAGAAGMIRDAVARAIGNVVDFAKSLLGIHSPSRVFMQIGRFTGQGMAIGLTQSAGLVQEAAKDLVPVLPPFSAPEVALGGVQGALVGVRSSGEAQPTIHQENHFNTPMSEEAYAELAARKLLRAGVGR